MPGDARSVNFAGAAAMLNYVNIFPNLIGRGGRTVSSTAGDGVGTPWMWTLAYGDHKNRTLTHGYESTRQAAMQAFARSWHRET
jgi:hypothetical protein